MLFRIETHENVVADLIALGQGETRGIQAFKNQLRIVIPIKSDADDLELFHGVEQLICGYSPLSDAIAEVLVVDGQIGCEIKLLLIACHEPVQSITVSLDRTKLNLVISAAPLVHDVPLHNLICNGSISRLRLSRPNHVGNRKQQQRNSSQTLLPINDVILDLAAVRHDLGNNAAEEMMTSSVANDFLEIRIQLTAIVNLPVVLPLVHRDDIPLVSALHQPKQLSFRTLHIASTPWPGCCSLRSEMGWHAG